MGGGSTFPLLLPDAFQNRAPISPIPFRKIFGGTDAAHQLIVGRCEQTLTKMMIHVVLVAESEQSPGGTQVET